MAANLMLPEPVVVCIQTALTSGRKLSWKLQESARGVFVQLVWRPDLSPLQKRNAHVNLKPELATNRTKRKKSPSQQRRSQRRLQEFLHRKKQLEASNGAQTKAQARGASVTVPATIAERTPCAANPTGTRLANKQLEFFHGAESETEARANTVPVTERPQGMATPIKDHSLASHSGTVDDIQLAGLVSCKSVQFESSDGTPGLCCTSASGEETWTPIAARTLNENEFATAIEAARGVSYRQRDGVPGLEIRKGCTRSSVSSVPVVSSPVACRTRTRTKTKANI